MGKVHTGERASYKGRYIALPEDITKHKHLTEFDLEAAPTLVFVPDPEDEDGGHFEYQADEVAE